MNIKRIGLIGGSGVAVGGSSGTGSSTTVVDNLESMSKSAALSANMGRELNETKAPKVGYAPDLKVNVANELVGRGEATPHYIGNLRPTGDISIGDGNATIAKIKGNSVVWNQWVPTFYQGGKEQDGVHIIYNTDGTYTVYTDESGATNTITRTLMSTYKSSQHKLLMIGCPINGSSSTYSLCNSWTSKEEYGEGLFFEDTNIQATIRVCAGAVITTPIIFKPRIYDLTKMFGAGNEPTTIEEFEARKPLGVTDEYNKGEIISYEGDDNSLKSIGFNAYNGEYAKVIGGKGYELLGRYTNIGFTTEEGGELTTIEIPNDKVYTPTENGYIYAQGTNICIHLVHSGYRNGEYQPYEEDTLALPNVKDILDADGNQLFPYGLLSAGNVYDEITETKAIKRVGVVDMGELTWWFTQLQTRYIFFIALQTGVYRADYINSVTPKYIHTQHNYTNLSEKEACIYFYETARFAVCDSSYTSADDFKQAMQGVLLYYELAEPIEVDLEEPLNMSYKAWDFGTEELNSNSATTPLNADIIYQFNAVDRIRENSSAIDVLEEHVEERKTDGIKLLTNGNLKLTLKGETREFMPATPSGDPMHYAYETAGANYNATADFIVKNAPWKDMVDTIEDKAKWGFDVVDASQVKQMIIGGTTYNYVQTTRESPEGTTEPRYFLVGQASDGTWVEDETKVLHLPGHWYLNGLGDITNKEMRRILDEKEVKYRWDKSRGGQGTWARTVIPVNTIANIDMIPKLVTPYGIRAESICITRISHFKALEHATALSVANTGTTNRTRYIQTCKDASGTPFNNACVVSFIKLTQNCNISNVPLLSKPSILYTINTATPTTPITITLHADRYAQLSADADIVAALEAKNTALEGTGGSISLVSA